MIFLSCFHESALPSKWHLKWRSCCSHCTASKRVGFIHARQLVIHSFPQNVLENTRWVSPRKFSSSLFPSLPPPSCYLLLTTLHQDLTVQKVFILWYIGTEFSPLSFFNTYRKIIGALRTRWEPLGLKSTTSWNHKFSSWREEEFIALALVLFI